MQKHYLITLLSLFSIVTLHAQLTDLVTDLSFPYDAARYQDELYITELMANQIIKIDLNAPVPVSPEIVLSGLSTPSAMTIDNGILYFAESGLDRISRIDLTEADPVPTVVVNSGLSAPNDLLIEGNTMYVIDGGNSQLLRVDLTVANPTPGVIAEGFSDAAGLTKTGDFIYVAEFGTGAIKRIDVAQTPADVFTVASDLFSPLGLTLVGDLLYAAESDKISTVDLSTTPATVETLVSEGINRSRNVSLFEDQLYITQVRNFGSTGAVSRLVVEIPLTFSQLSDVCLSDTPDDLGGGIPANGVYSGPGVTDNGDGNTFSFDPVAAGGVGTYTVSYVLDGETASSEITVLPTPEVTLSTGMLNVEEDDSVQTGLSGGTPMGGTYSGTAVTDDGNGMTYSFDPAASGIGEIEVTYTFEDEAGCIGFATDVITVAEVTSVTDLASTELRIFPNPTQGLIQLPALDLHRVTVYDATGRLVMENREPGYRMDVSILPAGLYLLKLYDKNEEYSVKLLKK